MSTVARRFVPVTHAGPAAARTAIAALLAAGTVLVLAITAPELQTADVAPGEADWVVVQYRQTGFTPWMVDWLRARQPACEVAQQGISLLRVYEGARHGQ